MSVLAGTSILREFLEFVSSSAQASLSRSENDAASADDLRHELDAFLALAVASYDELRSLTREATASEATAGDANVIAGVRDAHRAFVEACQPVLRLIGRARRLAVAPQRVDALMAALGEADLIANRYDHVVASERQAAEGRTRPMEDVRDELRRRVHAQGG
jgi:hypothetical protein